MTGETCVVGTIGCIVCRTSQTPTCNQVRLDSLASTTASVLRRHDSETWSSSGSGARRRSSSDLSSDKEDPVVHGCLASHSTETSSRDKILTPEFIDLLLAMALVPHLEEGGYPRQKVQDLLRFLHACKYELEDVCCILAHAVTYFANFYGDRNPDDDEAAFILVSYVYIAHCYVVDEVVKLRLWYKHFFESYCSMDLLNEAVHELMRQRGYCLRLPDDDLRELYEVMISI